MRKHCDCVFCSIIRGQAPVTDLRRHGLFVVSFVPLRPVTSGHRVFVHRRHFTDASDSPRRAGRVAGKAVAAGAKLGCDFNVIINNGPDATRTIKHAHWHLVPRRPGDGLTLPWTGQARTRP